MKNGQSSGFGPIFGLLAAFAGFMLARKFIPVLSTVLLVVAGILVLLVIGLVAALVLTSGKSSARQTPQQETSRILSKGRANLMELRRLALRVKNPAVRALNEEICRTVDKILRTLKDQPQDIPAVRQFLNYYLPTLGSILTKFVRVEESGVPLGDLEANTIACLQDIRTAMDRQYANLFEDDLLDLSVEMEALTIACKRDGLLTDSTSLKEEPETGITLTL